MSNLKNFVTKNAERIAQAAVCTAIAANFLG